MGWCATGAAHHRDAYELLERRPSRGLDSWLHRQRGARPSGEPALGAAKMWGLGVLGLGFRV